jgi:uncharacterized membrane protein YecN with MAPEG domain
VPITALYAGLLAPLLVVLAFRVIEVRREARIAVGDGGHPLLQRRVRVHANFAEYVPLALVLLALAESLGTWPWLLHAMGVSLLCGRIVHAVGMSRQEEFLPLRATGMVMTFAVLITGAVVCLAGALNAGRLF